jgi:hypothetical protein
MSADPQQMQQLLAMYRQMYPQNAQQQAMQSAQQQLGQGAPAGTNRTAGGVNALSQLALAMMRSRQNQQKQQQTPIPTGSQGQTLTAPVDNSSAPAGMMGPP